MNSFPGDQAVHFKAAMHDDLILVERDGQAARSNAARVAQAKTGRQQKPEDCPKNFTRLTIVARW